MTLIVAAGCGDPTQPTIELQTPNRGLAYLFPGIEGGPWSLSEACRAFRDAGVTSEIRILDWRRIDILNNLTQYERNRALAARVAGEIASATQAAQHRPIDLVGYSGGGGLALMVAEALPAGARLRNVVLAQAAVSPEYDLTPTLRRLDGKLVNLHSTYDWVILGIGTSVFGTMDRQSTVSAGKDGFNLESAVRDAQLRSRVVQIPWTPAALSTGHVGGHLGLHLYAWNRRFVAPYLLPSETGRSSPAESVGAQPD